MIMINRSCYQVSLWRLTLTFAIFLRSMEPYFSVHNVPKDNAVKLHINSTEQFGLHLYVGFDTELVHYFIHYSLQLHQNINNFMKIYMENILTVTKALKLARFCKTETKMWVYSKYIVLMGDAHLSELYQEKPKLQLLI